MSLVTEHSVPLQKALESQPTDEAQQEAMERLSRLQAYVQARNFAGPDLYDSLNSRLLKATPFRHSRLARLALIQFGKLSPINFRPLLLTPDGFNPKGGGLFLMGYLNLLNSELGSETPCSSVAHAHELFRRLKACCIPRQRGCGWGYNHDWQARAFYVPVGTPNIVTSVYVGRALLAYYRKFNTNEALELVLNIGRFILHEMVKFENDKHLCFSYIPSCDAEVHNASLHGAAFLSQLLEFLPEAEQADVRQKILKASRFAITDIQVDGSWPYGTKPFHRWVDNFHTAYNIECLVRIGRNLGTKEFNDTLEHVTAYYLEHLFSKDGTPRYRNTTTYPIDIHVLSQVMLMLNLFKRIDYPHYRQRRRQVECRLDELLDEFQDPKQGYFYFQKMNPTGCWPVWNKTPYIRWGQAWMFFALSTSLASTQATGLLD